MTSVPIYIREEGLGFFLFEVIMILEMFLFTYVDFVAKTYVKQHVWGAEKERKNILLSDFLIRMP